MVFKVWIGKKGHFVQEVSKLIHLINEELVPGNASILISPIFCEEFNWICDNVLLESEILNDVERGSVGLYTSGTTGPPKTIWKNCREILSHKKGGGSVTDCWLLTFNPGRWAGLSVILHTIRTNAKLVIPEDLTLDAVLKSILESTHVSLTPSLFRKLQLCDNGILQSAKILQVTFGGEYATQRVLDDAKGLWPEARITHIYASTELGDVCSVSDGLEGYPTNKFSSWTIDNAGQLIVDGSPTGDLWEVVSDRLYYKGRNTEIINIGGAKVTPTVIEHQANSIPGVYECRAYAVENPLLGQVVGLDYVGPIDAIDLRRQLLQMLPKYAVPVKVHQVPSIELTSANKISRN